MTPCKRGLQVLAVALDAREADTSWFHGLGHRKPFIHCFSHLDQVLGVEAAEPADVRAFGGGQLLAGLGHDVKPGVQVLVDYGMRA